MIGGKHHVSIGALVLLLAAISKGHAQPSDLFEYMMPRFQSFEVRNGQLIIDGVARMNTSNLDSWKPLAFVSSGGRGFPPSTHSAGCDDQDPVLKTFPKARQDQRVNLVYCKNNEYWARTQAYCGEGLGQDGGLFRWNTTEKKWDSYADMVAPCNEVSAMLQIGDDYWFSTVRPVEKYNPEGGAGITVFNAKLRRQYLRKTGDENLAGYTIYDLAHDKTNGYVFATSRHGLHRLDLKTLTWAQLHYKIIYDQTGSPSLDLSEKRPTGNDIFYIQHLWKYEHADKLAFRKAWESIPDKRSNSFGHDLEHPAFIPFIIDELLFRKDTSYYYIYSWIGQLSKHDVTLLVPYKEEIARIRNTPIGVKFASNLKPLLESLGISTDLLMKYSAFEKIKQEYIWNKGTDTRVLRKLCQHVAGDKDLGQQAKALIQTHGPEYANIEACLNGQLDQLIKRKTYTSPSNTATTHQRHFPNPPTTTTTYFPYAPSRPPGAKRLPIIIMPGITQPETPTKK